MFRQETQGETILKLGIAFLHITQLHLNQFWSIPFSASVLPCSLLRRSALLCCAHSLSKRRACFSSGWQPQRQGQSSLILYLSQSCLKVVSGFSQFFVKVVPSVSQRCPKVLPNKSQSCPKVSQSCLKVVLTMSQSYLKIFPGVSPSSLQLVFN